MRLTVQVESTARALQENPVARYSPMAEGHVKLKTNCAYNHTRECFLGLQVTEADIQYMSIEDLTALLTFQSGEGLWVVPFIEIPAVGKGISLDLIYLDEYCKVIEMAETFISTRPAPANKQAASVLVLPTHTLYSSQTQVGDLLVICEADEMESDLEKLNSSRVQAVDVRSAVLLPKHQPSGSQGRPKQEDRASQAHDKPQQPLEDSVSEPAKKRFPSPKNWLLRWLSPDPRKATRESAPSVAVYYWTGAAPEAHAIRDISATGLYLVSEERWSPGTMVLMSLQRTDRSEDSPERSIQVHAKVVRWGDDGVGLRFVLPETEDPRQPGRLLVPAASRKELNAFIENLKTTKE